MFQNGEFYESVAYNSNFLTGEKVENRKSKRDKGIKGKVLLELYDAKTNKKLQEAYTENLIPDLYFRDTFLTHFVQGIMGAGGSRTCNNHSWFEYIYL